MHAYWHQYWWLIFPTVGFACAFWALWLQHRRQKAAIDLLRIYAQQGKDPPAELLKVLQSDGDGRPPYRHWQDAALLGVLAVAFAVMACLQEGMRSKTGLIFATIVLAALTVNSVVAALLQRKHDAT
jgi:hypothetical protein